MKSRVIVFAVIEKENKLLFGKKMTNIGPYPNTYHLLGGGVNLDEENLIDAVKREIHEESGLIVEILEKLGFDEDYEPDKKGEMTHYIFLGFRAKYISGEIKPNDDINHLEWVDKDKISTIPLTRPSIKLFKELGYLK